MIDRKEHLERQIEKTGKLLFEWEDKLAVAENPSEKFRCETEIQHLTTIINGYKTELTGTKTDSNMKKTDSRKYKQETAKNIITGSNVIINNGNNGYNHINAGVPKNQTSEVKKKITPKKVTLLILNAIAVIASLIWLRHSKEGPHFWEPFISVITCLIGLIVQSYKLLKH